MSKKTPPKKIGIVSGLHPLAGNDVLAKIFQYSSEEYGAVEDLEYPEVILISRGIDGFDNKGSINDKFAEKLLIAIKQMEKEADIVGIACNTAYTLYDYIKDKSKIPIVNLIEEVAKSLPENKQAKYLLLTSSSTRNSKLYEKILLQKKINFQTVDDSSQKQLDQIIYKIMGNKLRPSGLHFEKLLKFLGAGTYDGIIAGCTELPLAVSYIDPEFQKKIINSNLVLAKSLTDIAYGRKNPPK